MKKDRKQFAVILSELLKHPKNRSVIKAALDACERYSEGVRAETLGWSVTEYCTMLDEGQDPCEEEIPAIWERAKKELDE